MPSPPSGTASLSPSQVPRRRSGSFSRFKPERKFALTYAGAQARSEVRAYELIARRRRKDTTSTTMLTKGVRCAFVIFVRFVVDSFQVL
jgi:hypothetical protein